MRIIYDSKREGNHAYVEGEDGTRKPIYSFKFLIEFDEGQLRIERWGDAKKRKAQKEAVIAEEAKGARKG